ncbi:DNA primase [Candidatus Woesearchaeota archaeon]|nr:DNA primase [Candidatus Woesearchaeota archaeon]
MGKISPISSKYIINTSIQIEGVVDRPDVIGAIFGQTEGLLGSELELRELQRSGRIGRIEVKLDTKSGKTEGSIIIPSSLDKAETVIIGAALETIQRIGPCNARVRIEKVEDIRVSKRNFVIERAKELLKQLTEDVLPDSQEITDEVASSVRMMEITEYGKDRLPAGPNIDDAEEVIVVEGRADVLNLLKHGIKNVVGMNGTSVPGTIVELSKKKTLTLFVDGDRGGDLIIKEVADVAEIDYVIKAPDGKEVEELAKKEIHKALRSKVAIEQIKMDLHKVIDSLRKPLIRRDQPIREFKEQREVKEIQQFKPQFKANIAKDNLKKMLDDLVGTRGAYILDTNSNILGKVPTTELAATIKDLNTTNIYAVVFDGSITRDIASVAEKSNVKVLVAMDSRIKPSETQLDIITSSDL